VKATWRDRLRVLQTDTPDRGFNEIVNTWNPYQCYMTLYLSRSIAPYSIGIGRGIGYRDTSQDAWPERLAAGADGAADRDAAGQPVRRRHRQPQFFPDTGEATAPIFMTITSAGPDRRHVLQGNRRSGLPAPQGQVPRQRQGTIFEHVARALEASGVWSASESSA